MITDTDILDKVKQIDAYIKRKEGNKCKAEN